MWDEESWIERELLKNVDLRRIDKEIAHALKKFKLTVDVEIGHDHWWRGENERKNIEWR